MLELASTVIEHHRLEVEDRAQAAAAGRSRSSAGRTSRKAKQVLGWEPKVPLREGLTKTIEYFDELIKSRKPS